MEQLRQEKLEIDQQLRAIQESTMGSMQSFPISRRSERGYSSDMDSVRSGRGGPRGRGRGRGGGGGNPRYHQGNNIMHNSHESSYNHNVSDIQHQKKYHNSKHNSGGGGGGGSSSSSGGGLGRGNHRTHRGGGIHNSSATGSGITSSGNEVGIISNGNSDRRTSRPPPPIIPK